MESKNKDRNLIFHFIPNTHWDREWLYNFQETRMFLVEFMDKLLKIFEEYPEYDSYLLDSQIIPIEDYLSIRPEKKQEIVKRIKDGKLQVGPWYTLPEEHLVNGESLVRNLLIGHRLSEEYGGTMKVGYSPFSYGQASQMPQIYCGFNIDTILFYHGVQAEEVPAEFIFEGADGTQLLGSRLGSNARYNFFFSVYRPVVFGKKTLERDYNWREKGLPFHIANPSKHTQHYILLDPIKNLDKSDVKKYMEILKSEELLHATTYHIACMQGMDSTQPDEYEVKVLNMAKESIEPDVIFHSSLPRYLKDLKASVKWEELTILKGERRTPRQLGTRKHLYGDVTSARTGIKRKNSLAEQELQRKAEPYAVFAYLIGNEYPKTYLDMAWKYLLKSHPHDTISGTGVDQIEKDVMYRLDQCLNISKGITNRSLQAIQLNISNADLKENEIALTVFNASPFERTEIAEAVIDIPAKLGFESFSIIDTSNNESVDFFEERRYNHPAIVRHLGDATMEMPSIRIHLTLLLTKIPAMGYKTLIIKPSEILEKKGSTLVKSPNCMENDFISVSINSDGTIDIHDKLNNKNYNGLHYFSDNGEAGHAWRHIPPKNDIIVDSKESEIETKLLKDSPLLAQYAITYSMQIPENKEEGTGSYITRLDGDGDDAGRSKNTRRLKIKSEFTLTKLSRGVHVNTSFFNDCEDHRLRVMFPTNLKAEYSFGEEPFDVVERKIDRESGSPWFKTWNPTHPHQRFVDVSDGRSGLAIINDGLREYEVSDDPERVIGITLIRAFEVSLTTVAWKWERHPEMKGSQVIGNHEFNYFIYPHKGLWDSGNVLKQAELLNVPLDIVQTGAHEGIFPKCLSFVEIDKEELVLSSMKKAEDSEHIIVRIYNPTNHLVKGNIKFFRKLIKAFYVNLNEEEIGESEFNDSDNSIDIQFKSKKIVTLKLEFE